NRADALGRSLLCSKLLRILESSREEREAARAPERSRGRASARRGLSEKRGARGAASDLLSGDRRAQRAGRPPRGTPRDRPPTDGQADTAPGPAPTVCPSEPARGGGVEGVGARGTALKLFAQLLGGSRPGGAVVRAGATDLSAAGERASTGREEPPPEQGEAEGEEAAEAERGPRRALGSQGPGPWTGEAAECANSAPAARAPQAPAGRGSRRGAQESGPSRSPSRKASARRAGPGRASDTMNFLLSWVHWSLALLLYLHHAKWSQAAPMVEGEQNPREVVKFMDVYKRSYCRPIETLVDIFQEYPDEIEYIFKPSCVPLMRCGGCCNDESLECVPTEEFNITMQIMRIKPHQGQHIGEMSFLQHSRCECRPKRERARQEKKSVRGKGKGQKRKRKKSRPCGPCSERRKHLFVQDPQTCKCSCRNTHSRCKARQLELNERTCRCDKPRR
ncbi:vascular endothelial growth factor A, partial [Heterocephalus glaber]|uniref:Vascular permeability factor n=2 Tax=Bathyergidae TaxID=10167 RepID=A0AAX6QYK7_HETGA